MESVGLCDEEGILQILVRSVMSLYKGTMTRVRVDSDLTKGFEIKMGMHQGSVLSPFCSFGRCCH